MNIKTRKVQRNKKKCEGRKRKMKEEEK